MSAERSPASTERQPVRGERKPMPNGAAAYLAFPEAAHLFTEELHNRFGVAESEIASFRRYGDLFVLPHALEKTPYWCRTALTEPFTFSFNSIGEAAAELKRIQRNWAPYGFTSFRRTALIQEKLPYVNMKPKTFPVKIPTSPIGVYMLTDDHTMLASARTTSFLPAGTLEFKEDHENPPSRAYLKLQEALTHVYSRFGVLPGEGSRCFDAGACPGGWTWVLRQLGCTVLAVDRAELAPKLMADPLVTFQKHDAFTLPPQEIGPFDWVCSDVICYPERLLEWVGKWLDSGMCRNMICTIKMQGAIDWRVVERFADIPDSTVLHLNYNKHELTWIHVDGADSRTENAI
ncbi:SAM-dependent methyltransferase [Treponema brennaborense]|uniref:Ribosomal RNA methyltransferase FtsJ domain-containing protein n=1 Tax=Treponema brennaborense (strain DSM 12168 / CIP 105900 / DD5/3) TaxID=906968 RepID=F4LK62_TREBD|nr:SAM-dependent methyltransferase [Treponema brennaborense]AEE17524.1 hypothetical protein Trebr_2109 [Treponema brennaborense DSM 12168]